MDPVLMAQAIEGKGLAGNANLGGKRQITILEEEVWKELCISLDHTLDPSGRRANLMICGHSLKDSRGKFLQIGEVILKINGETKPCERMDEFCLGLKNLMYPDWKGGAYAEVTKGGVLMPGQEIKWL
ncbi:MAG: MOSC domain-containing protein [Cytophagaceae bacterium]|jgi:MOSC domain-containing protein YiiM|nr:MOSC domain-containing protein [Cytophagaceae bacterium]